jgi:hypothetical protein
MGGTRRCPRWSARVRSARAPNSGCRLAAADVRLHIKLGDFARSIAMTDSVLRADSANTKEHASQLAALAAFAGRTSLATRYLRLSGPSALRQGVEVVPATDDAFAALLMRAALGVCDDSLRTLPASIVRTLSSYVGAVDRQQAADACSSARCRWGCRAPDRRRR